MNILEEKISMKENCLSNYLNPETNLDVAQKIYYNFGSSAKLVGAIAGEVVYLL